MKVRVSKIQDLMTKILRNEGYQDEDIPFIINMYLGGELRGHTSHGLASFKSFLKHDYGDLQKPEVIKATESCYFLDAKSNPGVLIGRRAADEAMKRAKKQIIGMTLIKDMDSWLRPGAIAEYIAEQGFISYVVNSGGGASIAPPGGYEPVTGTNPIAYGLPTKKGALVVDMATSKRAWGVVRMANKFGTKLPDDTFYDDEGNVTTDPKKADAVMSFGDYKGFALAFLGEVMTGAMLGMPMLIDSDAGSNFGEKMPDRGAYILVIDPNQTVGLDEFKIRIGKYIDDINSTKSLPGQVVRIPGHLAMEKASRAVENDKLDIPDELWAELQEMIEDTE